MYLIRIMFDIITFDILTIYWNKWSWRVQMQVIMFDYVKLGLVKLVYVKLGEVKWAYIKLG